jgi:hypothetical protein
MFGVHFGTFFFFDVKNLLDWMCVKSAINLILQNAGNTPDHFVLQRLWEIESRHIGAIPLNIWHAHKPTRHAAFVYLLSQAISPIGGIAAQRPSSQSGFGRLTGVLGHCSFDGLEYVLNQSYLII